MSSDRSFYGGEAPVGRAGEGGVDRAGVYEGPKLYPDNAPWKCPACKTDNAGPLAEGCVNPECRSGSVKPYRVTTPQIPHDAQPRATTAGLPPPGRTIAHVEVPVRWVPTDQPAAGAAESIESLAIKWLTSNPEATLTDAFVAGFQVARGRMIGAPPATVDLQQYAAEGKTRRTIRAALIFFKENILPRAVDEIASGELMSPEEIDRLIEQFTTPEDDAAAEGEDR